MSESIGISELPGGTKQLLEKAQAIFTNQFETKPTHAAFAPGRVNLIGEHTDYNEGFVFPIAIPLVTLVVSRPNGENTIRVFTATEEVDQPHLVVFPVPSEENTLTAGSPGWANYVKGVISYYKGSISGFDMVITTSVPLGGGLSSSASVEVATYSVLEAMFPSNTSKLEKALACQQAEHKFAGMPCGIMDQFISTMGCKDHALLIDCKSHESKLVPLELKGKSILIINCNVKHELTGSEYPSRRENCFSAASTLGVTSLRSADLGQLDQQKSSLEDVIYRRARHVITEIQRTQDAVAALENGDFVKFGRLMVDSHNSLRDDFEVSCPELDSLVEIVMSLPEGVYGSRMTGGGFGGCTVTLCDTSAVDTIKQEVNTRYRGTATFIQCTASDGARIIHLN